MSVSSFARPRRVLTACVSAALVLGSASILPALVAPAGATIAGSPTNGAFASTSTVDFKARCPGTTTTATLAVGVDRENANGTNKTDQVFANGATLTVTQTQGPSSPFSVDRTSANLTLPSDWSSSGNTKVTADFVLTYVAPTTAPADQVVSYTVSGAASGGGTTSLTTSATLKGDVRTANQCTVADTSAPVITPHLVGTAGTNGWYVSDVALTWDVTDSQSGIATSAGCGAYTQSTDTTSAGVSRTCSATNGAGLVTSVTQTILRDATPPTVDPATLQAGSDTPVNGVFNGPFTVSWSGSDPASGIALCDTQGYSGPDTTTGVLKGGCKDNAGNSAAGQDYTFGYDATGPTITPAFSRSGSTLSGPDSHGWFNAPFTLDWNADEAGVTCPAATEIGGVSDETASKTVEVTCTDAAGNEGKASFTYKYDQTAPTVDVTPSSDANAKGWRNAPFTLTASGDDSLSAGVTCDAVVSIGGAADETATGSKTMHCTDAAGNTGSKTLGYKYDETAPTASIALDRDAVHGWYNSQVKATTTYVTPDGGTETSPVTCTAAQPYSSPDAENASLSGTCTDDAGNTSGPDSVVFNYDGTAPTHGLKSRTAPTGNDGTHNWNNGNVTVVWTCTDATSGFDRTTTPATMTADVTKILSDEGAGQTASDSCTDIAGNSASLSEGDINIDKTAPTSALKSRTAPTGNDGTHDWNNGNVTVVWTCTDATSGFDRTTTPATMTADVTKILSDEGAGQTASDSCTDIAGNSTSLSESDINIDKTAPTVSLVDGPANGSTPYFGSVPAAPTCTASDGLSDLAAPCGVSGYSALVGPHTVTASATDNAGNTGTASASYSVRAWTDSGFYAPVDPSSTTWNSVKGGSTVPLKFEVFAGSTELTDTSTITGFHVDPIPSPKDGTITDPVDFTTTGGTSLRYDLTGGQFVQNWATPKKPGAAYLVTLTTQDGSTLIAKFLLK